MTVKVKLTIEGDGSERAKVKVTQISEEEERTEREFVVGESSTDRETNCELVLGGSVAVIVTELAPIVMKDGMLQVGESGPAKKKEEAEPEKEEI